MTVIRWNPLREIDDLFARAGHFPAASGQRRTAAPAGFVPPVDVSETESNYFIDLELAGVATEDVNVSVHEGVVTVAGQRRNPFAADHKPENQHTVHRSERRYGEFERRFRLPKDAEADAIKATAKDGIIRVSIGRRQEARRAIEVQVA